MYWFHYFAFESAILMYFLRGFGCHEDSFKIYVT